jgi:hypothetical protein
MEKILGFLVISIPGMILLSNFWWFDYKTQLEKKIGNINDHVQALDNKAKDLEGKIKPINPNKNITDASSQPTELDNPSKSRDQDIQELNTKSETLDKQISLLGEQQQNFITNGQNTVNFLLTVIVAYIGYNTVKESFLNREEKKEMKEKIKTELKPVLEETKGKDIEEITVELKWLQYQMTILAAEQLEQDQYQSLTALYEYIRAMVILGDLKTANTEQKDNEAPELFLYYQLKNVTRINEILEILIERDPEKLPSLNPEQAVKFKKILSKIPDTERSKVQSQIEKILDKITTT